eukprot:g6236.t2
MIYPKELGALPELRTLYLENIHLAGAIPEALGDLSKLKKLRLNGNQLSALWDYSRDVVPGEELLEGRAALEKLLALFSRMNHINLDIGDNPWEEPPQAVLKKGMPAACEYFADLYAEGATIRRSVIKVVLVGQEGAGKASARASGVDNRLLPAGLTRVRSRST